MDSAAVLIFGAFLGLLAGGLWIPFAIGIAGLLYILIEQGPFGLRALGLISWGGMNSFTLTAVPMFLLMAELLLQSGVTNRVYRGLSRLVMPLPGGLLQTNIVGCAVFSAISGSSVATAAAIGRVAIPQLLDRHYDRRLSAGSLAAGGTLGILIPPSIAMIIYGTFTETSISQLFMAGLVPGLLCALVFMVYIAVRALADRTVAPVAADGDPASIPGSAGRGVSRLVLVTLQVVSDLVPFAVLIGLTLGSLYLGVTTPTEAAALGCLLALAIAFIWGDMTVARLRHVVRRAMKISASLLFIVFAAYIFSYAVGIAGLGRDLTAWIVALDLGRVELLLAIFLVFTILGCLIDSIGMMVITVPLLYPILLANGIDLVWFGVVLVLFIELGQLTPPLGVNLFVIQSVWSGRIGDVVLGCVPFYFLILSMVAVLMVLPDLALWLPAQMAAG